MAYINLIIKILQESTVALSAKEISIRLSATGHTGSIKKENITPKQIRDRIREDLGQEIETLETKPLTYQLKKNDYEANLELKQTTSSQEIHFKNWIQQQHNQISRPEKYTDTINTISRNLERATGTKHSLYGIDDVDQALVFRDLYFSFKELYDTNKRGNNMYSRSLDLYIEFLLTKKPNQDIEINKVLVNKSLSALQRQTIILSRIGQGKYRKDLIKLWGTCSISGFSDIRVLTASHIKPWRHCNNIEKIDKFNGLLLLPTYDKLFDLGFISFNDDGTILISQSLIDVNEIISSNKIKIALKTDNIKYIRYHRERIFRS